MSKESLDCADKIIMDAYVNGMSILSMNDNKVVQHRLKLFGEWIDGGYYLNERGFDYAMNGCRKGLSDQIEIKKKIDNLTIRIQSFSVDTQNASFWISIIAAIASIIGFFIQDA